MTLESGIGIDQFNVNRQVHDRSTHMEFQPSLFIISGDGQSPLVFTLGVIAASKTVEMQATTKSLR